jgi:ADP-heptose:LPS heptosyltransferase
MISQLFLKIFARINLGLGLILAKRKPPYDFGQIKNILIKRTDKLGDAAVTLPLLLELNKHFKVTVLTSKYNDYFLNKFLATRVFSEKPLDFFSAIISLLKSPFSVLQKKKSGIPKYDLLLDLNGARELDIFLRIREMNLCRYYASFNLGLWNILLDYADPGYPVLFSKEHIIDSTRRLTRGALGLDLDIPDYTDFSPKMVKPQDFNIEKFILVNIAGIEQFRGPTPGLYAQIVNALSFNGKIVIMDELARPHLKEFEKYARRDNIVYLERDFSIWELLYIASKSSLFIGSDSGISNLLQGTTHAVIFFATGMPRIWRPYSRNPYQKIKFGKTVLEETVTSKGLKKKIIYRPTWCNPCFDMGCARLACIKGMDIKFISNQINSMLKEAD